MRDSSIKTSIEKAIGEEKWLTEDVVRKLAGKQPPQKESAWSHRAISAVALVAIVLGSIFLFMTQPNSLLQTSASPDWRQLEKAIEDEQVQAAFIVYLKAGIDKDYAAFKEVSNTQLVASPKEVFERYEHIDWSTFRVVAVMPSRGEPVTTIDAAFQYKESDAEVVQSYSVELYDDKAMVSEPMYQTLPEYTPFAFPERIELAYTDIPEAQRVDREFSEEELLYTYDMQDGQSDVVVHKPQDGEYEFYARRDGETYYLTTIYGKQALGASWGSFLEQPNGDVGYYLEVEGLGFIGLVFFEETISFLETPKDYTLERRYFPEEEKEMILITGEQLQVVRFGENGFESVEVEFPAVQEIISNETEIYEVDQPANHVQVISRYLEGEKKAVYDFVDQETLVKRD